MAISPNADGGHGGPGRGGNSLAAIVKAAVGSIAEVVTAWGKMPAVRTLMEYLGRKLLVLGLLCGGGLVVGGKRGTIVAVASIVGLLIDTGIAAWNERNRDLRQMEAPDGRLPPAQPAAIEGAREVHSGDGPEQERRSGTQSLISRG